MDLFELVKKPLERISTYPLINFEIQRCQPNEPKFNCAYSKNNLLNSVTQGAYVLNLDEFANIKTDWAVY